MPDSILNSIKKLLGLDPSYTVYDVDILMHINSVFSDLHQLGVGPADAFSIEDDSATWDSFLGDDNRLSSVRSYVFLRVKLLFDTPGTSFHIEAMQEQINKFEWRLNVVREGDSWTDPSLPVT